MTVSDQSAFPIQSSHLSPGPCCHSESTIISYHVELVALADQYQKVNFQNLFFQQMSRLPPSPLTMGAVTDLNSSVTNQRSVSPTGNAVTATKIARTARMRPTVVSSLRDSPLGEGFWRAGDPITRASFLIITLRFWDYLHFRDRKISFRDHLVSTRLGYLFSCCFFCFCFFAQGCDLFIMLRSNFL